MISTEFVGNVIFPDLRTEYPTLIRLSRPDFVKVKKNGSFEERSNLCRA
jgi:hypothetical protein